MTTKRELERKARHVFGDAVSVTVKLLSQSDDGAYLWEVRLFSNKFTVAARRTGPKKLIARAEACEVMDAMLAALDKGEWSWKEPL